MYRVLFLKYRVYLFSAYAFTLLLPIFISNIVLIILVIAFLLSSNKSDFKRVLNSKPAIYFFIFYLIHCIGLIYSNDRIEGVRALEIKLPFILLPLIIFGTPFITKKEILSIIRAFVIASVLSFIVAIVLAATEYLNTYNSDIFFYTDLSYQIRMHPLYLSLFYILSIIFSVYLLKNNDKYKVALFATCIILSLAIVLLASRIIIISYLIILFLVLIFVVLKTINKKFKYGLIFLFLLFAIGVVNSNFLKERFNKTYLEDFEYIMNNDSFHEYYVIDGDRRRILNLKIFFEAVKDPSVLLFGMGNGSGSKYLNDRVKFYRSNYFAYKETLSSYNFHNQYLEVTIELGILGLLSLLLLYFHSLKSSWNCRNYIYILFIILIVLASMTETILDRNKGLSFFVFFSSILSLLGLEVKNKKQ